MSRTCYIDIDGNYSYYGYEDSYDESQQTEDIDEVVESFDKMIESSIELDRVVNKLKEQLKPEENDMSIKGYINPTPTRQPSGFPYNVMRRTVRDEEGTEWVEDYNGKTGQWELQYYLDVDINDHDDTKAEDKQCTRGMWCYECKLFHIKDKVGYCTVSIPCKSFIYKGK